MKLSKLEVGCVIVVAVVVGLLLMSRFESFEDKCRSEGGVPIPVAGEYCSFVTKNQCITAEGEWTNDNLCKNDDGTYKLIIESYRVEVKE